MMFGLLAVLLLASPARAEEGVPVAAGLFLGIIKEDGTGPYQQILHEAAERAGLHLDERVYPLPRALNEFSHGRALAIYGMTEALAPLLGEDKILTTYPLGVYKLYIFTRKGEAPISSLAQLKGKRVGGLLGYERYYRSLLDKAVQIDFMADESAQLRKLENGRVAAVLGFMPDWIPYLGKLAWDPGFPVMTGYDYLTVWNTPRGKAFVDAISPALQQMHRDGTLKRLLGKRFMSFHYRPSRPYEWQPPRP
ncbi:transporter substrate-binding domain-containing protein [Gallaecimonas kandeliae]|uniref:substrate-binding periplasmic protein n=1 Tax=Gallaecimonas kandeliae TaxID=3029055 RepID=UPI002649DCFD|nr:transporter substrate-binding domain-containing protein [Gallaecimonas kandeliae]WKE64575.1 transporter substrate-binding domain-containing protein [Gallaecimonas kandeliae]